MSKFLLTLLAAIALATTSPYAMDPREEKGNVPKSQQPQKLLPSEITTFIDDILGYFISEKKEKVPKRQRPPAPLPPLGIAILTNDLLRYLISYSEPKSVRVMAQSSSAHRDKIARNIGTAKSGCKVLWPSNSPQIPLIPDTRLMTIKSLTYLNLSNNDNNSNTALSLLINLTDLNLSGNQKITDDGLATLPHLTRLDISNNTKITINGLMNLSGLKDLNLGSNSIAKENLSKLTTLMRVGLSRSCVDGKALLELPYLTDLDLRGCCSIYMEYVSKLTTLKKLVASGETSVYDMGLIPLTNLEILDIGGNKCNVTSKSVTRLTKLTHLKCSPKITDEALELLTNLEDLTINSAITDVSLSKLTKLIHLKFSSNPKITDEALKLLTNLETLEIAGTMCNVTSKSVSRLIKLRSLNCEYNPNITDETLEALLSLKSLKMTNCPQIDPKNLLKRGVSIER